tara:strand:+ start:4980 stop:5360 length:381 start_codon:yes stop_codon:yes gene_type:complete
MKYKIRHVDGVDVAINKLSDSGQLIMSIPLAPGNLDYDQFVADVVGIGTSCVEGATIAGVVTYTEARMSEYPSLQEQQDMQYWDAVNGTTTWKDKITSIKTKYPKSQVGVTTIAPLPQWVIDLTTS